MVIVVRLSGCTNVPSESTYSHVPCHVESMCTRKWSWEPVFCNHCNHLVPHTTFYYHEVKFYSPISDTLETGKGNSDTEVEDIYESDVGCSALVKKPNILIASRATTTHAFCNHTETNISITDAVQYDESAGCRR